MSTAARTQIFVDYIATMAAMFIARLSRGAQPRATVMLTSARVRRAFFGVAINAVAPSRLVAKED
jgi:hypothetical protein